MEEYLIRPVAHIHTDFKQKFGVPRQSGRVDSLIGKIVFTPEFRDETALRDIEKFSHLWLIFGFSLVPDAPFSPTVRPPRLGGNYKTGVFASRSPFRPNRLGLSSVRLMAVEKSKTEGYVLLVSGADLVDGTPIYDIKPYLSFSDSHPDSTDGYAKDQVGHLLKVNYTDEIVSVLPEDKRQAVIDCIAQDPRPSYVDEEREYGMSFGGYNIRFTINGEIATVIEITKE